MFTRTLALLTLTVANAIAQEPPVPIQPKVIDTVLAGLQDQLQAEQGAVDKFIPRIGAKDKDATTLADYRTQLEKTLGSVADVRKAIMNGPANIAAINADYNAILKKYPTRPILELVRPRLADGKFWVFGFEGKNGEIFWQQGKDWFKTLQYSASPVVSLPFREWVESMYFEVESIPAIGKNEAVWVPAMKSGRVTAFTPKEIDEFARTQGTDGAVASREDAVIIFESGRGKGKNDVKADLSKDRREVTTQVKLAESTKKYRWRVVDTQKRESVVLIGNLAEQK